MQDPFIFSICLQPQGILSQIYPNKFSIESMVNGYHIDKTHTNPGSSGTRLLQDNLSDLKAQIAANHKVFFKQINFRRLTFLMIQSL